MAKVNIKTITAMGVLIAFEIILSRFFSIQAWNIKIGFNFVPIVAAAIICGPVFAGTVAALGDFLGALLFPIGAYFPGFTLTAFLTGVIFGIGLRKESSAFQTISAVLINQFLLSLFLNTFWISVLYGSPYWPLFITRIFQSVVLSVVQIVFIQVTKKSLFRLRGEFST